jgi:hypothetical protein
MSRPTPRENVIEELRGLGLHVRTYDEQATDRLMQGLYNLHWHLCLLDNKNIKAWKEVSLMDVVDAYAKRQNLRVIGGEK